MNKKIKITTIIEPVTYSRYTIDNILHITTPKYLVLLIMPLKRDMRRPNNIGTPQNNITLEVKLHHFKIIMVHFI